MPIQQFLNKGTFNLVPSYYNNSSDYSTIELASRKLIKQSAHSRGSNAIETNDRGKHRVKWVFLAPNEIVDNVSHNWEPYESIATRLAQTTADIHKATSTLSQIAAGGNKVAGGILERTKGEDLSIEAMKSVIKQGVGIASGQDLTSMMNFRIDTPLLYKDSKRREYSLAIPLAAYDLQTNQEKIFSAIRKLQEMSCAKMADTFINIEFPYVFSVRTVPTTLININYAALQSVQVTWKAPYKRGYPIEAELQLTLIDIEPLFRKSFESGGVTVRTSD